MFKIYLRCFDILIKDCYRVHLMHYSLSQQSNLLVKLKLITLNAANLSCHCICLPVSALLQF